MVIFLLNWEIWAGAKGEQGAGALQVAKLKPLLEKVAGDRERGRLWWESQLGPRLLYGITWGLPRPEQTVALAFVMPPTWVQSDLASALRPAPPTPEIFTSCILKFLKGLPTSYSLNPTVERRREVPIIKFPGQVFLPDLIYSYDQPC